MPQKGDLQLTRSASEVDFIRSITNYTSSGSSHRYLLVDTKDKTAIPFKTKKDVHNFTQPSEEVRTRKRRVEEVFQADKNASFISKIILAFSQGIRFILKGH